jgi:hypothetical protein
MRQIGWIVANLLLYCKYEYLLLNSQLNLIHPLVETADLKSLGCFEKKVANLFQGWQL